MALLAALLVQGGFWRPQAQALADASGLVSLSPVGVSLRKGGPGGNVAHCPSPKHIPWFRLVGRSVRERVIARIEQRARNVEVLFREVAKPGIAPGSGPGDRGFESLPTTR
jgi:hypothetical protein